MRRIIVDGYNVINSDVQLAHAQRSSLDLARRGLIARLGQAQPLRHDEVTVVFDGWRSGAAHQSATRVQGIRVVYSPLGERADEVIKRLVSQAADPSSVVVVSNDRELRVHAGESGAHGSGAENLLRQATPARRPRALRPTASADDDDDPAAPRGVCPPKKGPARRLPKSQRGGKDPGYRF